MKKTNFQPKTLNKAILFLFTVLFSLCYNLSHGQGCTNSLIINTGYDPCTNSAINPSTTAQDPRWTVTNLSPDDEAYVFPLTPIYQAYVPPHGTGWVNHDLSGLSQFICINNTADYVTHDGRTYDAMFQRQFYMCAADAIVLDINVEVDFCIVNIWVDCGAASTAYSVLGGGTICYSGGTPAHHIVTPAIPVGPGCHTICVELVNDAWECPANGYGFCMYGTVSTVSTAANIGKETVDPIAGSTPLCMGSSYTFSDPYPGGTWGCSPTGAVSFSPLVGSPTTVTPTAFGPVDITYTGPPICNYPGCSVDFLAQVPAKPDVCVTETCCDYLYNFTTTGWPGPITADYNIIYDCGGCTLTIVGSGTTGPIPYSLPISAISPTGTGVCVLNVYNDGCGPWPVPRTSSCCANANYPFDFVGYKHSVNNGVTPGQQTQKEMMVSPSPNTGTFNITGSVDDITKSKEGTIEIVDMLGKIVHTDIATIANGEINKNITLSGDIPNGVYLIKFKAASYKKVFKFTLDR